MAKERMHKSHQKTSKKTSEKSKDKTSSFKDSVNRGKSKTKTSPASKDKKIQHHYDEDGKPKRMRSTGSMRKKRK